MPHRSLIAIVIICILVVAGITAIRISEISVPENDRPAIDPGRIFGKTEIPAKVDPAFFEPATKKSSPAVPVAVKNPYSITAPAYISGNVLTGDVYVKQNNARALPVASMSKLVTAFASTDQYPGSKIIEIQAGTASTTPPDASNLKDGERFTMDEILYPLLLSSSNVAAEAIASSSDRSAFQKLMSSYAWEVGMPQSYFADPSGVSSRNVASADDLFALARYLYKFRPDILAITRVASTSMATTTEHGSHEISSTHPFVHDPRFIGGKTGRTPEAGETMMTILRINDQPVAFIVLGSRYGKREADTRILVGLTEKMVR